MWPLRLSPISWNPRIIIFIVGMFHTPESRNFSRHTGFACTDLWRNFLLWCRLSPLPPFSQSPHGLAPCPRSNQRKSHPPAGADSRCFANGPVPETRPSHPRTGRTLEQQYQGNRSHWHTRKQSRRTILLGCRSHTSSNKAGRRHSPPGTAPPKPGCHRFRRHQLLGEVRPTSCCSPTKAESPTAPAGCR